ncbi:hypothetical protein [Hyunsoonleella pacifica]|uniref:DUF3857 domain-containing protein n=1 Tax=Hyunsoonleella pacifica TaxID=1080224 RepID=A0A4Q9FHY2_9FLAO|nr:hypothetical protein [Hyunsoonleella pacifica]TBN11951.1 hypothetical protein EYD46_17435 [Hyunsoonleella pacifica]GGD07529.1 hypothetical protein GCM10011368_06830 [Hyunsoonleella pacifica]
MKLIKLILLIFLHVSFTGNSQIPKAEETLKKVKSFYDNTATLNLEVTYSMYRGYTGNTITESYKGKIYKDKNVNVVKILNSEVIQFQDAHIVIDNTNKTISYNAISNKELQTKNPIEISHFLNYYKETNTKEIGTTIVYQLELINKQLPLPYHKVEIHINKNSFTLEKQIFYLSKKMPFLNKNSTYTDDVGRMEIKFQQKEETKIPLPQFEDYIAFGTDKKPRLTEAYSVYTLVDQTNL